MSGHITCKVGDLCEQIRGVTYAKADAVASRAVGFKPVLRANSITDRGLHYEDLIYVPEDKISLRQYVKAGDVLIAASSGSLDAVGKAGRALSDFDGGFGAFCKVLRPNEKVDAGYFAHFFQTKVYRRKVSSLAAGANINNLRNEHLDDLEIRVPSLSEQRRIAAILDKADTLRAKRRKTIAKLDQLLQSVFLDTFGDPETNPRSWPERELGEVTSSTRIGIVRSAKEFGKDFGTPYVRMDAISANGRFLREKVQRTSVTEAELRDFSLESGDLLFNTRNSKELVGKSCVFLGPRGWTFNNNVMRIRFKDCLLPAVAAAQFRFSRVRRELEKRKSGTTSVFAIYWRELRSLPLLIPSQDAQKRFAVVVEKVSSVEQQLFHEARRIDALFASLQHRAFSGTL